MSHGPLPPVPILVLPLEVTDELTNIGLAALSRNPSGEFSAGDWWMGLLLFSGAASNAITLTQGVASIPRVAKRLHQWFLERFAGGVKTDEPDNKFQLSYQSSKGHGALTLNEAPSLEVLTHWLAATYAILEGDAENRQ